MIQVIDYLLLPVNDLVACQDKTIIALQRLGIKTVADLLFHLPFRYDVIKSNPSWQTIANKELVRLSVKVIELPFMSKTRGKRAPYKIPCDYNGNIVYLTYFNFMPQFLLSKLREGSIITVEGQAEKYGNEMNIAHPKIYFYKSDGGESFAQPVYNLTYMLNSAQIASYIDKALERLNGDYHNSSVLQQYNLLGLKESLENLHHSKEKKTEPDPESKFRKRLAFDEILAQQIAITKIKLSRQGDLGIAHVDLNHLEEKVREDLPFTLTQWQEEALKEIKSDMSSGKKMMRLLQGDVGCGKTIVSLLASVQIVSNGKHQVAIMAPLDILATQHYAVFSQYLEKYNIKVALLTGKIKGKKREKLLAEIAAGQIDIVIGTHALFQEKVEFSSLALVIIDEQHRFGVMQRLELLAKSENQNADMLLMTATPIPRTLTQSIYGDLDISTIAQKPADRKDIITALKPKKQLQEVMESIVNAVKAGEKVYWICPLIEENEEDKTKTSVEARYESFKDLLPEEKIGYIHGRMNDEGKNSKIDLFKQSPEGMLLIATTVIEVGIDVPSAKIIVIENAEKFGLSQLHQLRGRVGRADQQCYCILLYDFTSPLALERMKSLRSTCDGFKIAELDLELRGAGDVAGFKQSGLPDFKFFNWSLDKSMVKEAKMLAETYVLTDPDLASDILRIFDKTAVAI